MFEIGRTFGIVQYDKENALKVIVKDLGKTIGGLSMRAAPTGHSQSQGSVGNVQRTLHGQLRTLFCASARVDWLEVDIGINVHLARETCSKADRVNT